MALIGPRPYFDGDWEREPRLDIPARRLLRAGLVGPFQAVKGRVSGLDRVNALDAGYLEHLRSASLPSVAVHDVELVVRSLATVLRARGFEGFLEVIAPSELHTVSSSASTTVNRSVSRPVP
jgi:lipopolysaccharide/colanic/teichoic acid biosynthesis glycosyltransferase